MQKEKCADFKSPDLGSSAYTLIVINYNHRLWHKLCFIFFFAATADVCRNEGNEAFKKGDFINAIYFYTEGIKLNCNEKVLKAKLYNNRAIAHSKLGKMMRALTSFFLLFWSYCAVCSSFLKKMIILNACPEKYTSHLGLSSIQRSNLVLQISMRITSFCPKLLQWSGSGLATCMANQRYLFLITGNHQDSLRDAEAAIELNPTFLKAIVRG